MINALREVPIKYEGIGRRQRLLLGSVGMRIGPGAPVGFGPGALKGKGIASEKMAVQRLWPAKPGAHLGDFT